MNLTISRFIRGLWIAGLVGTTSVSAQEVGTVSENNVNVRGRAGFIGEVLTKVNSGESVQVLDRVTLSRTKSGEPAEWLKIALPANTPVWIHGSYVDPTSLTVTASRLKVRGGPGVNYSVLGFVERGTTVTEISRKGDWLEIAPTQHLSAYIAASMVNLAAPAVAKTATPSPDSSTQAQPVVEATTEEPIVETVLVAEEETLPSSEPIEPPGQEPVKQTLPGSTTTVVADPAPAIVATDPTADRPLTQSERAQLALEQRTRDGQRWYVEGDPDDALLAELPEYRRKVTREGIIRRTASIQSPSSFSLNSERNGLRLNYLYTSSTNVPLGELLGVRVRITGEEGIDERWPNTPVLLIKSLDVIP